MIDFFEIEPVDKVGEHDGILDDESEVGMSAETDRLERHGKRKCVGEGWGDAGSCEGPGEAGTAMDVGTDLGSWGVLGRLLSIEDNVLAGVGGMNEM